MIKIIHKFAQIYWQIFKPNTFGVRAILMQDNQVLLVKHKYHHSWFLPGGGTKKNESSEEAIDRELKEELGCTINNKELIGIYINTSESKKDVITVFISNDFRIIDKKSNEIEAVQLFSLDNLPKNISPGTRRRLTEYKNGSRHLETNW